MTDENAPQTLRRTGPGTIVPTPPPPPPKPQWVLWLSIVLFVILTLGLATAWIASVTARNTQLNERVEVQDEQIGQLLDDLRTSQANAQRLYDQLIESGQAPEGDNPDEIPTGVPGVTGPRGSQGDSGRPPTAAEIAEAVAEYCATGACVGTTGTAGATGASGAPGESITGPTGPQGPAGAGGPACPDGYAISFVWLSIADTQFGIFSRQPAAICRPN